MLTECILVIILRAKPRGTNLLSIKWQMVVHGCFEEACHLAGFFFDCGLVIISSPGRCCVEV